MKHRISVRLLLVDSLIMNVLLTVVVYGSIYANPLTWLSDYPPDVQAAAGAVGVPIGPKLVASLLSFVIIAGTARHLTVALRRQHGGRLDFVTAFIHHTILLLSFSVWDLVILDWLLFVTIQPSFVIVPGTEGLAGYQDYWFHLQVSFLSWPLWVATLSGGLILAALSVIRPGAKQRTAENDDPEYYDRNKTKLLAEHQVFAKIGETLLAEQYDADLAAAIVQESTDAFERLIPELPYIGGDGNPLMGNLALSASALAFYRTMQQHGKSLEETGALLYRIMEAWIRRYPRLVRRAMGWYYMSEPSRRLAQQRAQISQQRRYAGDWVFECVSGDDEAFEWGRDFTECGIAKFLHTQGADELTPYLCLTDYALFGALGIKLERTMTLADGCEKCDFRFTKGESPSGWPPPWLET